MSRRTAEANKAILAAWNREQENVQEGKGTRKWTIQQQQDILDKGKAYDEDGVVFQGQHMKSAEMYPEYQDEPENIQFLTRAEHLEAHDGNWRNPTNWYFNPVTKEKTDFGDGKFIPCEVIQLAEPVVNIQIENKTANRVVQETVKELEKKEEQKINRGSPRVNASAKNNTVADIQKQGFGKIIKSGFRTIGKNIIEFPEKHPTATKIIGFLVATTVAVIEKSKSGNNSSNSERRDSWDSAYDDYPMDENTSESSENSYTPNDVPAGNQRYYYKDGSVKWKEKPPYHRGGDKDE